MKYACNENNFCNISTGWRLQIAKRLDNFSSTSTAMKFAGNLHAVDSSIITLGQQRNHQKQQQSAVVKQKLLCTEIVTYLQAHSRTKQARVMHMHSYIYITLWTQQTYTWDHTRFKKLVLTRVSGCCRWIIHFREFAMDADTYILTQRPYKSYFVELLHL